MQTITTDDIKNLYIPPKESHKGQNGRLLIIGGSHLFHAASLWALQVASRIVDLVHYSSIDENNKIVQKLKEEFRNGIVIHRQNIEDYIMEDDTILIGPGMTRDSETEELTHNLLIKYPQKKWVIDAGALQMLDLEDIPNNAILTPHHGEFELLISKVSAKGRSSFGRKSTSQKLKVEDQVFEFAKEYRCVVLLKGEKDIVSDGERIAVVEGGNAGMTKGGTGDVLAGLIAALYCKNDAWLATIAGSFINKKAGEDLFKTKGYWFNASDLADQIPETMKRLLL